MRFCSRFFFQRWRLCLSLLLVSAIVNGEGAKKRVCIVGAGLSGLVTAKSMGEYPNEFETVVFEKNSDSGGLWIYTDSTTVDEHGLPVHSSMYKNLRTNGIKAEMNFPDYPSFGGKSSNWTFVKHEEVLEYLRNYTDQFNLRQYIQFNTNVEKIKPLSHMKWLVVWRNLNDGKMNKTICDFLLVCNGHNFKGNIPEIWGIESFKGQVLHSHVYRKPEPFANQTVVLLGSSYSAVDISIDVTSLASKVYLSHRHDKLPATFPSNLEQVPGVVGAEDGKLVLSNGTQISADSLILATGYVYVYPFLGNESGIIIEGGKQIHTLYKYIFNADRPTMAFVGVPEKVIGFQLVHAQANYIQKVLRGKISLPSRKEMILEAEMQLAKQPPGQSPFANFDEFCNYQEEIMQEAGGNPLPWWVRPYLDAILELFDKDPVQYKNYRLVIHENNKTVEFRLGS